MFKDSSFSYFRIFSSLSSQIIEDWVKTGNNSHKLRDTWKHDFRMGAIEVVANKLRMPKGHFTGLKIELNLEPAAHRAQTRSMLN